jgi:peptidoglycan/LPS O-acetylase OafA/YrhL
LNTESPTAVPAAKLVRPPKTGYLPSLDGWRAVAILGVMMTHDRPWNLFGHSSAVYKGYGGYGVYLFFAISGFLITTRILEEEKICGYFDIRRFYVRRLFRIQPAALAYLATVALLMVVGISADTWSSWFAALFLYLNFTYRVTTIPTMTGHFWTLAVEEHFYILLSLTMLFVKRRRTLALTVLYLIFMLPVVLSYGVRHGWYDPAIAPRSTQWQLQSLLLAALMATLVRRATLLKLVRKILPPWSILPWTVVLMEGHMMFGQIHGHAWPKPALDLRSELNFMAAYLFIPWVLATVFHPASWTTRFLETKPMRFIGRISYSLYLWHVLVYDLWHQLLFSGNGPFAHLAPGHLPYSLLERPLRFAASFGMATLSYYYIEKPLIRMGHRLAPPATPGRPELDDLPVETPRREAAAVKAAG